MLNGEAIGKVCPFMTRSIHESPIGSNMPGITTVAYTYCMADICMSWEQSIDFFGKKIKEEGYCKLIEKDQYE